MKILLISDVESPYIWDYFKPENFRDIDLVISCGDLKRDYLSFIVTMIKAPLYYVPGNHDEDFLENPPDGCECIDGKLVTYKGVRILGLGGSINYKPGNFKYSQKEMTARIMKLTPKIFFSKGFDILVTHAPALGLGDGPDFCHTGFKSFVNLMDKYSPKYFFHGHQHLNYGKLSRKSQYKNTKIINAFGYTIVEY